MLSFLVVGGGKKKIIFSFSYFLTRYLQILRFYSNENKIIVKNKFAKPKYALAYIDLLLARHLRI